MSGKITESLNNVARTYAMSKDNMEVYESILDRVDGSNEIISAHVSLFNDIIQECGDEARHEAQLVYWLKKTGYITHIQSWSEQNISEEKICDQIKILQASCDQVGNS